MFSFEGIWKLSETEMAKVIESYRFMELNRLFSLDVEDCRVDSMQPEETEIIVFVWKIHCKF